MKKLTFVSLLGLAIILFALSGVTYYVTKNYVPPAPTALSDSLSMAYDSMRLSVNSALTAPELENSAAKKTDSLASTPNQNMIITSVLSDTLAAPIAAPEVKEKTVVKKQEVAAVKGKEEAPTLPTKSVAKETIAEATPPQYSAVTKPTIVTSKGVESSIYYVVVGTFTQETNAKDEMKLYPTQKLAILKDGVYFRLVAGKFPSAQSAKQKSQELKDEGITNFVLHK